MYKMTALVLASLLLATTIGGASVAQNKDSDGKSGLSALRRAIEGTNDAAFRETVSFGNPTENAYTNAASRDPGFFLVDDVADTADVDHIVNPTYADATHGDLVVKASVRGNCLQQHPGGYFKLFFSPGNVCGGARYWKIPNRCFISATKIGECSNGCWIWEVRIRC